MRLPVPYALAWRDLQRARSIMAHELPAYVPVRAEGVVCDVRAWHVVRGRSGVVALAAVLAVQVGKQSHQKELLSPIHINYR